MGDEHEPDVDAHVDADVDVDVEAVVEDVEASDVRLEREEHGEVAAEADDDVHAQAEEQPQPDDAPVDVPVLDEDAAGSPEDDVAQHLRAALGTMREEADRIATLGTSPDQVAAAERFAEDAGRFDAQIGSAARAADDERG